TRFSRDWSSDVCSSDLEPTPGRLNWVEPQVYHLYEIDGAPVGAFRLPDSTVLLRVRGNRVVARRERANGEIVVDVYRLQDPVLRSEERRVGKEGTPRRP